MSIMVFTKQRGLRQLKPGITLRDYQEKLPDAIKVQVPDIETLKEWESSGGCETLDGCWVEPDGTCAHGYNSWLIELGYI